MNKIVKITFSTLLTTTLLTGCANNIQDSISSTMKDINKVFESGDKKEVDTQESSIQTKKAIEKPYKLHNPSSTIKLSKAKHVLDNGTVTLKNGKKFIDEDGNIKIYSTFNGKDYYIVNKIKDNAYHLLLKNSSGKVIKSFTNLDAFQIYTKEGKFVIATHNKGKFIGIFHNLYEFDGKSINVIDKNFTLPDNPFGNGSYRITRNEYGDLKYEAFLNHNLLQPSLVPEGGYPGFLGVQTGYHYKYVYGSVGDVIVYSYKAEYELDGKDIEEYILEARNTVTGENAILTNSFETKFQFLSNGEDVVFKEGNRIIDIRTLKKALIDDNFEPIVLTFGYDRMGGNIKYEKESEYTHRRFVYTHKYRTKQMFHHY